MITKGNYETLKLIYDIYSATDEEGYKEHNVSEDMFMRTFINTDVLLIRIDGNDAGGVMFDGRDIHVAIKPEYRGRWLRDLKHILNYGFSKYGEPLVAHMRKANKVANRFAERLGLMLISHTHDVNTYLVIPGVGRYG